MPREMTVEPEATRRVRRNRRYRRRRAGCSATKRSAVLAPKPASRSARRPSTTSRPVHLAPERFWDRDNIQPICRECYDRNHFGDRLTLEQLREREAWIRRLAEYEK